MKRYNEFINETKYYNETLNPKFWNDNKELNSRIKGKLLTIANDFYDGTDLETEIKDIHLTGSLANYNYNDYSDFDVHILVDFSEINDDDDLVRKSLDGLRFIWNTKHDITIQGHEVELYIQDEKEKHTASGLYSLMNSEWIKEPVYKQPTIDDIEVKEKTEIYQKDIDRLDKLSNGDTELAEIDIYFDYAKKLKTKIHQGRKEGLDSKQAEYSVENLVFKELRNSGHFGVLIELIDKLYDKQFIQ